MNTSNPLCSNPEHNVAGEPPCVGPYPFEEDEDVEFECPACGGPCYVLGGLGNTTHYRCRDCGLDSSHKAG